MQYELILNPNAGRTPKTALVKTILREFPKVIISQTRKRGDATLLARKSKADIVIAAGGDGTVSEVATGLLKRKKKAKLGILPVGTANLFAKHMQIPFQLDDAISCIKEDHVKDVDVGEINGRCFFNAAGIGLDAAMFKNVQPQIKKLFGQVAYPISALQTFFTYEPKPLTVKTKGLTFKGYYVIVFNIGQYGPMLNILPQASNTDGKLDVVIFQKKEIYNTLRALMGVFTQGRLLSADVVHLQTTRLRVMSKSAVLYHADAELGSSTPTRIRVNPRALSVVCPEVSSKQQILRKSVGAIDNIVKKLKLNSTKLKKRLSQNTL